MTGASRGIGAAIAKALAEEGWPVGVNYRSDAAAAEEVVRSIEEAGGRALALAGGRVGPGRRRRLFTRVEEELGPVLVLVNNAGVRADNLSPAMDDEEWQRVIDTNLSAAFRMTRRALRTMIRDALGEGRQRGVRGGPAGGARAGQLRDREGGPRRVHEDGGRGGRAPRR